MNSWIMWWLILDHVTYLWINTYINLTIITNSILFRLLDCWINSFHLKFLSYQYLSLRKILLVISRPHQIHCCLYLASNVLLSSANHSCHIHHWITISLFAPFSYWFTLRIVYQRCSYLLILVLKIMFQILVGDQFTEKLIDDWFHTIFST